MAINIQLDVPALERLINNDPDIAVEIKKGVLENFWQKNLKPLANDTQLQTIRQEIAQYVNSIRAAAVVEAQEVANREFGTVKKEYSGYRVILSEEVKAALREVVRTSAREIYATAFEEHRKDIERSAMDRVKTLIDAAFEKRVQEEIARRVAALAGGQ